MITGNIMIGSVKANSFSAISKKHKDHATKALYFGTRYNKLTDLKNEAEGKGLNNAARKFDREAEAAFNKHLEFMSLLPKKDQAIVEKSVFRFK
jgi:hypothetical protein